MKQVLWVRWGYRGPVNQFAIRKRDYNKGTCVCRVGSRLRWGGFLGGARVSTSTRMISPFLASSVNMIKERFSSVYFDKLEGVGAFRLEL